MVQSTIKTIQNEIKKREAEIDALKRALSALGADGTKAMGKGKRRTMTPEARERIRQAQIKRWKAVKGK